MKLKSNIQAGALALRSAFTLQPSALLRAVTTIDPITKEMKDKA